VPAEIDSKRGQWVFIGIIILKIVGMKRLDCNSGSDMPFLQCGTWLLDRMSMKAAGAKLAFTDTDSADLWRTA